MRIETVPIDISSEQKNILGIISQRQLIYLLSGSAVLYILIPKIFAVGGNYIVGSILSIIISIPVITTVFILGFIKKRRMFYDQYLLIKFKKKYEKGKWRKGKNDKEWMVNFYD